MGRFDERVVLITGGASGIGNAAVRKFHREGACVAFADTNDSLAEALVRDVNSPSCLYIRADIGDENQAARLVEETVARFGGLDVLVNNAAIFILKSIDATVSDWEQMLRVNIMGQALVTRHAVE